MQALARAVGHYRELGRRRLRLNAAEDNTRAVAFYLREGFRQIGSESSGHGKLLLMEKKLRRVDHESV